MYTSGIIDYVRSSLEGELIFLNKLQSVATIIYLTPFSELLKYPFQQLSRLKTRYYTG